MTDRDKFCKLFDELGIDYKITEGGNIQVDPFFADGAEDFYIDFWDGEDYPDGEFKEFVVFGDYEDPCERCPFGSMSWD